VAWFSGEGARRKGRVGVKARKRRRRDFMGLGGVREGRIMERFGTGTRDE